MLVRWVGGKVSVGRRTGELVGSLRCIIISQHGAYDTCMRLPETRDLFARTLEFPVPRDVVIETVGSTELSPPDGESTTIGAVIERSDVEEFDSADDLYDTLMSLVGAQFVGRRYYDDRGSMPQDEENEVSF